MSRIEPVTCLGVVGFSTRALAQAARDLGFQVVAIDAFCDHDTQESATCFPIANWPKSITRLARKANCDGWVLAGGMENHRRLLADLEHSAPVFGPTRTQLAQLRSQRFKRWLARAVPQLNVPQSSTDAQSIPFGRMFKPFGSSGGLHVYQDDGASEVGRRKETNIKGYWQQFVTGRSLGVTCCIHEGHVSFCGATESLSEDQWPAHLPFVYRGSMGPFSLSDAQKCVVLGLARSVGERLNYRGWLQADFVEDDQGQLWLLEINPRWTAGMEVLHHCASISPLASHLAAFRLNWNFREHFPNCACMAKAILYADNDGCLDLNAWQSLLHFRSRQPLDDQSWWDIADIPATPEASGMQFATGQPLMTIRVGQNAQLGEWAQTRQFLTTALKEARRRLLASCDWLR